MISEMLKSVFLEQDKRWQQKHSCSEQALHLLLQIERDAGTELTELIQSCSMPKGAFLLRQGDTARHLWVLLDGIAREFITEVKGCCSHDSVSHFFWPGHFVCNYHSVFTHNPAGVSIQMATAGEALRMELKGLRRLEERIPLIGQLEKLLLDESGEERKLHTRCITNLSATEHYKFLCDKQPMLVAQLPVGDLASYMGITLASLSRIRSDVT